MFEIMIASFFDEKNYKVRLFTIVSFFNVLSYLLGNSDYLIIKKFL